MSQASSPANSTQYVNRWPSPTTPSIEDEDAVSDKSYAESIVESIEDAENAAFVLHRNPDPDAIASGYAGYQLAEKHDTDASIFYAGEIGFEENQEFADMLDAPFTSYSDADQDIENFDEVYALDTNNGELLPDEVPENVTSIIDHHSDNVEEGEFPYLDSENKWIEDKVGATATLMAEILDYDNFFASEVEDTVKENVAAASIRGMEADTLGFVDEFPRDKKSRERLEEYNERFKINGLLDELESLKEDRLQDIEYSSEYEVRIHNPETPIDNLKFFEVDSEEESDVWRAANDEIIEAPEATAVVSYMETDDGLELSIRLREGDEEIDIEKSLTRYSSFMEKMKNEEKAWGGKQGLNIHSAGGFLKDETADNFNDEMVQMAKNYNTGRMINAGSTRIARDSRKNAKTISRRRVRRMPSRTAFGPNRKVAFPRNAKLMY